MGSTKKYSYDDWWTGRVCLNSAPAININPKKKPLVTEEDIREADMARIKKKQKVLFNNQVKSLLKKWKSDFLKRYNNSRLKETLLTEEIKQVDGIFNYPILPETLIIFHHWIVSFTAETLKRIQQYHANFNIKGLERNYDFMHSPNSPYQDLNKIPDEIYAESCMEYWLWLKELASPPVIKTTVVQPPNISNAQNPQKPVEPANLDIGIFKNGYACQFFLDLKQSTVKEDTLAADYGFIFFKLKDPDLKAIHPSTKHKDFFAFLKEKCQVIVPGTKFPKTNPKGKQAIYNELLKKHQTHILK